MTPLQKKVDFAVVFRVTKANPNGDPLNGNRPRTDYAGNGEMTDVCLKRKLRDRLLDRYIDLEGDLRKGQTIFVQSDDHKIDAAKNLRVRAEKVLTPEIMSNRDVAIKTACAEWFDVRAFGQVFPFKGTKSKGKKTKSDDLSSEGGEPASEKDADGISIPVRGPVTIQSAFSINRIDVESQQIVKSTSLEGDGEKRQSDQMGMKHRVDNAVYVFFGSMNPQLAVRTGFSDGDAQIIHELLPKMFENDASSARPDGSMEVLKVIWWKHNCKSGQYSSAKVHRSLSVDTGGTITLSPLDGLIPDVRDGF